MDSLSNPKLPQRPSVGGCRRAEGREGRRKQGGDNEEGKEEEEEKKEEKKKNRKGEEDTKKEQKEIQVLLRLTLVYQAF